MLRDVAGAGSRIKTGESSLRWRGGRSLCELDGVAVFGVVLRGVGLGEGDWGRTLRVLALQWQRL